MNINLKYFNFYRQHFFDGNCLTAQGQIVCLILSIYQYSCYRLINKITIFHYYAYPILSMES